MRPSETLSYNVDILSMELRKEDPSTILTQKDHILCKYREKSRHYKIHAPIVEKAIRPLSAGEFSGEDFKRAVFEFNTLQGPV